MGQPLRVLVHAPTHRCALLSFLTGAALARFVDKHKQAFSMTNNLLLSMVCPFYCTVLCNPFSPSCVLLDCELSVAGYSTALYSAVRCSTMRVHCTSAVQYSAYTVLYVVAGPVDASEQRRATILQLRPDQILPIALAGL